MSATFFRPVAVIGSEVAVGCGLAAMGATGVRFYGLLMAGVDERWVRAEINRLGLKWRQEYIADDLVMASYYDGMMRALGAVLTQCGLVDPDGAGQLIETAKGIEK